MGDTTPEIAEIGARVARAHGITATDLSGGTMRLRLSAGGPAFTLKGQGTAFVDVGATVRLTPQKVTFTGPDWVEEWQEPDLLEAYRQLARGRRRLRWSRADAAAFGAAALWTYVSLPFLLAAGAVAGRVDATQEEAGERWDRVALDFGAGVATHSPRQTVYVDGEGLIRRHDYTALAFGSFVTSAHLLEDYKDFGGIRLATRRHVHPRVGRVALRRPTVVHIEVHDAAFTRSGDTQPAPLRRRRRQPLRAPGRP